MWYKKATASGVVVRRSHGLRGGEQEWEGGVENPWAMEGGGVGEGGSAEK